MDTTRAALLVIDVQNDFCPGGALAVADGDRVIPVINLVTARFGRVIATRSGGSVCRTAASSAPSLR